MNIYNLSTIIFNAAFMEVTSEDLVGGRTPYLSMISPHGRSTKNCIDIVYIVGTDAGHSD